MAVVIACSCAAVSDPVPGPMTMGALCLLPRPPLPGPTLTGPGLAVAPGGSVITRTGSLAASDMSS
jgi:hypothetical protein